MVEFRLDAVDGELIGSLPVNATGGKTNYALLTAKVKKVPGIHDLFIVARNQGVDRLGHLFNINWFTFTHEAPDPATQFNQEAAGARECPPGNRIIIESAMNRRNMNN